MKKIRKKQAHSIGILGLGSSGKSAINYFNNLNCNIFAFDDNDSFNKFSNISFLEPKHWPWQEIKEVIVSPGISISKNIHPAVRLANEMKVKITSEIDLLARKKPKAKIIGITGTNGKSTTTAMLEHIIKGFGINCKIGGNYGIPASSINDPGENGFIILELSSYQLELCKEIKLDGAIILNITPDHLERHSDILTYAKLKFNISNCLKPNGHIVINKDDKICKYYSSTLLKNTSNLLFFSGKDNFCEKIKSEIILNNQNISAIIIMLNSFGFKSNQILKKIISFQGLPHRLELIGKFKKIKFINDSKATNDEATKYALNEFKRIYWIAGGRAKSEGIKSLKNYLNNVIKCYLIGESSNDFAIQLNNIIPHKVCFKLDEAINEIFKDIKNIKNATVLFSPAAASFDQYNNFEIRGEEFKKLVFSKLKDNKNITNSKLLGEIS